MYNKVNFNGLAKADGLTEEESKMLRKLVKVFNARLLHNQTRMEYYEDKNKLKNIGLTIPCDYAKKIDTRVGWVAKAVDYLSARSIYDGITSADGDSDSVNEILNANDFAAEYMKAVPSQLVYGVGFWTVSKGGEDDDTSVVINYHNATSAAALWDFRHKRVKCGFVVEDYELVRTDGSDDYRPCFVVFHTPKFVIELKREARNHWSAKRKLNLQNQCLMIAMPYRPNDTKPFGKSRVSGAAMAITDEMQRQIVRTSLHSESYSSGQKALLGVSDEQFDKLQGQKFRAALSELLLITRDENGEVPQITAFAQQSMTPHIEAMQLLMSRMAAETAVPVAAYGLSSNGYTSTEALRASSDDLILEAESLNRNNGKAIVKIARLAYAIANNTTVDKLTQEERDIAVHWVDPSMPTAAAQADASVKISSVATDFPQTDVFWEFNGFDEEQRRRIKSDITRNQSTAALNAIFSAGTGEGNGEESANEAGEAIHASNQQAV